MSQTVTESVLRK